MVVAIAIITILIAAVGPSIAKIMQRDKESELIFRGKQYARGIFAFHKRYGRYPNELKELLALHPRSIRQLWPEPMCNCDDWQVIIAGSPEAAPMGLGPMPPGGGLPGSGGLTGGQGLTPAPPGNQPPSTYSGLFPPTTPGGSSGAAPTPAPFTTGIFASGHPKTVGAIVGVRSKVRKKALRKWRGRDYYDEWRFIAGDADYDSPLGFDPNTLRPDPRRTPGQTESPGGTR